MQWKSRKIICHQCWRSTKQEVFCDANTYINQILFLFLEMRFCIENQSLSVSDYHLHGLSPCLTDTITSSVVSGIAVLGSIIQLSVYAKYATHTDRYTSLKSKLFKLHVLLHILLMVCPISQLVVEIYRLQQGRVYAYQLICTTLQCKHCISHLYNTNKQ
mgnify:FL=1